MQEMKERKESFEKINGELLNFLDNSPTSFHAVANMRNMLEDAGFKRLLEGEAWTPGRIRILCDQE